MSTITQFPSGNTRYRIEFDYLARTFVVVTLVNSSNPTLNRVLEVGRDYRFLNPAMIEMLVDQSGFDIVRIHRQTGTDLVVDFRNGSVLTASDLTNAELQAIHIAEEGRDQTVDLAKEYADAAGSSAGNAKDSEDEARRIAERIKAAGLVGYITRRSFEKGFNVTTWNEVLLWEEDGAYYRWDGTLPKNVPAGSTPETSGGIGLGSWVSVGDASLRADLIDDNDRLGDALITIKQPYNGSVARTQHSKNLDTISVKDFGAKGDGESDDTVYVQAALDWLAGGEARTIVIPDGTYNVTNLTLSLNGTGTKNCKIISHGVFKHIGSGNMLLIKGGMYCQFELRVTGEGYDASTIPDYTIADPIGANQAFVVESCRACKFKVIGHGYPGRVFRTRKENTANVKLSLLDLDITTGNDTCGQAMYLQGTDAWGCITFAQTSWDYFGSVIDTILDISVVYWEAGCKNRNKPVIHFKEVTNSHFTTLAAGGAKMLVEGGAGITIQKALLGESQDYALEVIGKGEGQPKHQLTIHSMLTANTGASGGGIRLSNAVGVTINDTLCDGAHNAVVMYNLCRDVTIKGHFRNSQVAAIYAVQGSTLENVTISGKCYAAGNSGFCDFSQADTKNVTLVDTTVVTKGFYLRLKDNNNGVNVRGGNWSGTEMTVSAITMRPSSIKDVTGINTRKTASKQKFASGSESGTTLVIPHGLWKAPNEVFVTVLDQENKVAGRANTVIVKEVADTHITFKYSGGAPLSNDLHFQFTAKAEERSN